MQEKKVKRVGVISVAAVMTVIDAIVGLICGIIVSLIGASIPGVPAIFGALAIIVGLVGGAFAGFISGAIFAILYNIAARYVGGVIVEVE